MKPVERFENGRPVLDARQLEVLEQTRAVMLAQRAAGCTFRKGSFGVMVHDGIWTRLRASSGCCAVGAVALGREVLGRLDGLGGGDDAVDTASRVLRIGNAEAWAIIDGFDMGSERVRKLGIDASGWHEIGARLSEEFVPEGATSETVTL